MRWYNAYITLKSGNSVVIENLNHIKYPDSNGESHMVVLYDDFFLYDKLLTFVGNDSIVTLHSSDIEFIKFNNAENEPF
ncbi:hypothetical protein QJR26_12375 [Clostridium baratii]